MLRGMDDLVLDPPTVASEADTGVVLDVAGIGIEDPIGTGVPYLLLADGTRRLLPEALRDWAIALLADCAHPTADDRAPVFPCRVEFGVLDGHTYAALRGEIDGRGQSRDGGTPVV